ncbi:regulator of sigma E protease [Palleronia marisminoris]|uniref:Zinc metalloprotease n=1 Tax=Palleronia marisminoris TaxID=315423 RepID=A0A1Y5R9H3_9RHOB|nr:RIP metalloprotease RseP [Palleronia marisminoris]SFG08256.1 regulator of sigma E protease [Palleronia marisminoris]SLN11534.1 Regulator of sigma-E protease RseP [Palleronia marisminoris]
MGFIPDFGSLAFTIVAFVAALSIIVAIHEYGHYIVGRWSGIQADVFSIGMGPVLFARTDRRGTRWQIAAFPVGGYVKFRGDANAASVGQADTPGLDPEGARATMAGAPLWARAATVAAGPIFNFILSILVFAAILMIRGVASDPMTVSEVRPLPYAVQELQVGDRIEAIAGEPVPEIAQFASFVEDLPVAPRLPYRITRDGAQLEIDGPYPYPPVVGSVTPQSAAAGTDLEPGEVVTAVNGQEVFAFTQLRDAVGNSDGQTVTLTVWSPETEETRAVELTPKRMDLPLPEGGFETRWLLGITGALYITPERDTPNPFSALAYGVEQVGFIIQSSLSGIYHIAAGAISSCNLQGPIGIAQTSGAAASAGALSFVWFIAVLSTAVGFLNLFPIPILDGGHLVFHAYEAVRGRPPSDQALNVLMAIGLALLGTLMVFAIGNDFLCP